MNRRGYALPFVIIAVGASAVLAFSLLTGAWRSHRAGRLSRRAEGVALASDGGLADAQLAWRQDSLWKSALGLAVTRAAMQPGGIDIDVRWRRSHPLVAWLNVRGTQDEVVPFAHTERERWRVIWLDPPRLPLGAALSTSGTVTGHGLTFVSGTDTPVATMPCGVERDVQNVAAVVAVDVHAEAPAAWPAVPAWQTTANNIGAQLESVWPVITSRSSVEMRDTLPAPLPASSGWQALSLHGPSVVISGPTAWRGLLAVRGPLRLQGDVTVEGILAVRGPLDARGATLRVRGAVVAADSGAPDVQLGGNTQIEYDRCAAQMALATVAAPRSAPFFLWQASGQ